MIFSLRNASKHTLPRPEMLASFGLCWELATMLRAPGVKPRQCRFLISDALDLALVTYGDEPGRAA